MNETAASADVVLVERDGDIVTVVLNRPEKLNALNKAMWSRVGEVMHELGGDESIRCVVSVSMLTEGWDANTVTHILGVRAFGTQLLCEQVCVE